MHVVICPDAPTLSRQAAVMVAGAILRHPEMVMGLAAGATPIGLYHELVRYHANGLDFSGLTVFGLDEYLGLDINHPTRFRNSVERHLLSGVNIQPSRVHWPDGHWDGDLAEYCAGYEQTIVEAGGIDLQILGIGVNGHLGFNEPGCSLAGRTGVVRLSATTLHANETNFASRREMPEAAITLGIGSILDARAILLAATGESKATAVAGAVEGPVTAMLPASALQLHPNVTVFLDDAAASHLRCREAYDADVEMLRRRGLFG